MNSGRCDDSLGLDSAVVDAGVHLMALNFLYLLAGLRGLSGGLSQPLAPTNQGTERSSTGLRDQSNLHMNPGRCTYSVRTTPIFILGTLVLPFTSFLHADTLTFQAGVFSHSQTTDTWLQGAVGNADHDTNSVIEWDGADAGGENFLVIRFDDIFGSLPGQIQPSDVITSATLSYTSIDPGDAATVNEI